MIDVLKNLSSESIDHPPYLPDLSPSEYILFLNLKKMRKISNESELIAAEQNFCTLEFLEI